LAACCTLSHSLLTLTKIAASLKPNQSKDRIVKSDGMLLNEEQVAARQTEPARTENMEATGEVLGMIGPAKAKRTSSLSNTAVETAGLLDLVRGGNQDAFNRLYKAYAPMVHGILLSRVPYREVEDLVQDVFLTAYRQLKNLRDDDAFGGWLATITRNRAMDYYRKTTEAEELTESHHPHGTSQTEALEILMVIKSLPEAYRETL